MKEYVNTAEKFVRETRKAIRNPTLVEKPYFFGLLKHKVAESRVTFDWVVENKPEGVGCYESFGDLYVYITFQTDRLSKIVDLATAGNEILLDNELAEVYNAFMEWRKE
jgi:hypothetical protein